MATVAKKWQLYDERGRQIKGRSGSKEEILGQGLLHAASHVWIWRHNKSTVEVLLQKRSAHKRTWANRLDISTAGHIYLGNDPLTTALHETNEEIGLELKPEDLKLFGVNRAHLVAPNGAIENEFQFLYIYQLQGEPDFTLHMALIDSLFWKPLDVFAKECGGDNYVDHSKVYYQTIIQAITAASS